MTLTPEDRQVIIDYRIEHAHKTIEEAEYVAKGGFWNLAANRLYYATFYMCEALLLKNKITTQSHGGVSRMINLHFVKTNKLNAEDSRLLSKLFRMRQAGDYEDLTDWTKEEIEPIFPLTKQLISKFEELIKN